jgi:hypothetical protein
VGGFGGRLVCGVPAKSRSLASLGMTILGRGDDNFGFGNESFGW